MDTKPSEVSSTEINVCHWRSNSPKASIKVCIFFSNFPWFFIFPKKCCTGLSVETTCNSNQSPSNFKIFTLFVISNFFVKPYKKKSFNFPWCRCFWQTVLIWVKIAICSETWIDFWLFYLLHNENIISTSVSEAVEKIPADEKDYRKCSFIVYFAQPQELPKSRPTYRQQYK